MIRDSIKCVKCIRERANRECVIKMFESNLWDIVYPINLFLLLVN